jgi:hypothetical protein
MEDNPAKMKPFSKPVISKLRLMSDAEMILFLRYILNNFVLLYVIIPKVNLVDRKRTKCY